MGLDARLTTIETSLKQYRTGHDSTAQHSTVQHSTTQHNTTQYSTVQYSTVQYSTVHVQYSTSYFDKIDFLPTFRTQDGPLQPYLI